MGFLLPDPQDGSGMNRDELSEDIYEYMPPVGKRWEYVGDCVCNGQDGSHFYNDEEWELVDV